MTRDDTTTAMAATHPDPRSKDVRRLSAPLAFSHSTAPTPIPRPSMSLAARPAARVAPRPAQQGSSCPAPAADIPHSVKGAPAHLRQVIRKRQNSESAKRSRKRRKEAAVRFYQRFDQQCQRIAALEKQVAQLADLINETGSTDGEMEQSQSKQEQSSMNDTGTEVPLSARSTPRHDAPYDDPLPFELLTKYVKKEDDELCEIISERSADPSADQSTVSGEAPMDEDLEKLLDTCIEVEDFFGRACGSSL